MPRNQKKSSSNRRTSSSRKHRRGSGRRVRVRYDTPAEADQRAATRRSARVRAAAHAVLSVPPAVTANALDMFATGLYCPELETRGPCLVPQNTFVTAANFNYTVNNLLGATPMASLAMAVGDFWSPAAVGSAFNSTIGYDSTNAFSWENQVSSTPNTAIHGALLTARANTASFNIGQRLSTATLGNYQLYAPWSGAPTANVPVGAWTREASWDADTAMYSSGAGNANPNPRRVVSLKVVVTPVSAPLYVQGAIRGGDNGTIAMSARNEAVAATDSTGVNSTQAVVDVFDPVWPDAFSGTTGFTRDPRIKELGAIAPERSYEFVWVPTAANQLEYEDEPLGGTWCYYQRSDLPLTGTLTTNDPVPAAAFMCNILRRGPVVIVVLDGLSTTNVQSFQVRATIKYEHTVTPYGNANVYNYSRKAPWFSLPWDRMSILPTAGCGAGTLLTAAARDLETGNSSMRVGEQPSIARALLSYGGGVAPAQYSFGTVNPNGAPPIIGSGLEGVVGHRVGLETGAPWYKRVASNVSRVENSVASATRHAGQFGAKHASQIAGFAGASLLALKHLLGRGAGAASRVAPALTRAGPIVEEVAEGAGEALMIAL